MAKVLNAWRRSFCQSAPPEFDSASAFTLITLQPHRLLLLASRLHYDWMLASRKSGARGGNEHAKSIWGDTLKKITFVALALVGLSMVESPKAVAQDSSSQQSAADSTADAIADQQLTLLRKDIRSIKKQLIAENLTLTDSEATKFWQVYGQYSAETDRINETRTAIIKEYAEDYGTLTDDQADNLIRRWLDTDIEQTKLRQQYVAIFRKVLPGKKAATFFQLDRRISTMIDLQVTSQLPLVQSQN
jgi:hypothetical protein